uniref:Intestinal mucin-like protein n=1 Tax=Paramormyrops kingsleyae TaxID=1676925 RepID=A0A3B3RT14_9TELE|nr:intestinal mucin-like protein [Paramormyrops kingsleyae]
MPLYNVTDYDGWCFSAFCTETCGIVKHFAPCSTAVTSSPTSPTTVPKLNCLNTYPPRKNGESWRSGNCSTNTCVNGSIIVTKTQCKPTKTPVCVNGYSPVKVYDDSGCCFQEECRCLCSGWGDPHYITFDGTYYPFQGNCSYVLVKEIYPKYNFSVIIQNYYCDAPDHLSCPQSLTVYYKSYEIMMTQKDINGIFKNLVYINNKQIFPAYKNSDFSITDNGIDTLLYIPDINAWVSFRGLMFSIDLPYSKFFNNTEGQCGTCDNNRTDDCLLPNGTVISSCPKMANHWKVHDNETCPPPVNPTPPPHPPVCNRTICELLKSKVFEKCHKVIPYEPYYEGCSFDVCHMPVPIGCSTLQMYASLCAAAGICVDWRNQTHGVCAYKCQAPKVYEPCGPLVEPTCNLRYNKMFFSSKNEYSIIRNMFGEGCYCPPGSTLMSPKSDVCMKSCDVCMLPNGQWKEAGSVWTIGCDTCECLNNTLTIDCEPMECPYQPPLHCNQEGQVLVTEEVDCCPKAKCACNSSLCSPKNFTCDVGFTKEIIMGPCCPIYFCVPMGVCVFNNTPYQPGDSVPEGPCVDCVCGASTVDPNTKLHVIECTPKVCDLHCSEGYEYQDVAGQCCGRCVQASCIVHLPSQTVHIVQPGTVWAAPNDPCIKYECAKIGNQFITTEYIKICPFFNPASCIPGTVKTGADGCCPTCVQKCNVTTNSTYLVSNGCRSSNQVILTTCKGSCDTSSVYSLQSRTMEYTCSCCQEITTTEKQVEMTCPDGSTFTYTYLNIEQCGCVQNECPAKAAGSSSILKKP